MSIPASIATPDGAPVDLVAELAELGARYDAAPLFPAESLACLVRSGLHMMFAPVVSGGVDFASARVAHGQLFDQLRIVGRGDLSVGRLYEGHVNALKLFDWYGTKPQQLWLKDQLKAGAFFGVWATEPSPGVVLHGNILQGAKSFASGAGGLAYAVVTARVEGDHRRLVIVPANDPERADLSGWRVRGMRATGSGQYDLEGLTIAPEFLLGAPGDYDREPRFTTGAWRFLAVQLGGIEGLLAETRAAMTVAAKEDPLARANFAKVVVAARTAYLWTREAAMRAANDDPDGPAFASMTRGVVERAALDVMELSARLVGTKSAFDGNRIDKISRDLSFYLRQAGPDYARDRAAIAWIDHDAWGEEAAW